MAAKVIKDDGDRCPGLYKLRGQSVAGQKEEFVWKWRRPSQLVVKQVGRRFDACVGKAPSYPIVAKRLRVRKV